MNATNKVLVSVATIALSASMGYTQAAGAKPPESTSKIKKVLLYDKVGGWVHTDGIKDVDQVMTQLSGSKKFALTKLADDGSITLDYLKQFQVIVWNNNVNGASSVPSTSARKAVIDYVNGGGGWLLIHGAGDHGDTWADLKSAMGTKFTEHGNQGNADAMKDPDGLKHKELKYVVQDIPDKFRLRDEWYGFQNTVRPISGVTVLFTAGNGDNNVLRMPADGRGDYTYIWAREMGKGRLFYDAIGHGQNQLMSQADSVVPKLYWQAMRYLAGDFQNGCTNASASNFDPEARVDDGTCSPTGIVNGRISNQISVVKGNQRFSMNFNYSGTINVQLRDVRGAKVWSQTVPEGTNEISLSKDLKPGVYYLVAKNAFTNFKQSVVIR